MGKFTGSTDIVLKNKLKNLRKYIKDWWNIRSNEIHKKKKEIHDFLCDWDSKAEAGLLFPNDYLKREECLSELNLIDKKERDSLKQESRVKWVIEGDENTKFFHSIINKKIKNHNINGINFNGVWNEDFNEIQEAARYHFANRFKELNSNRPLFHSNLFMKLDNSDVSILESEFTLEEVKEAVWTCSSSKSPSPDGLNLKFIKRY